MYVNEFVVCGTKYQITPKQIRDYHEKERVERSELSVYQVWTKM